LIGQKAVSSFRVGPVLANQRNALANAVGELLKKLPKTLVESDIAELAADKSIQVLVWEAVA
jgi:hypothetical protein